MKILNIAMLMSTLLTIPAFAAQVVATVNGTPITDTDITVRTQLMAKQGKTSTDNRRVALQNIIDRTSPTACRLSIIVKPIYIEDPAAALGA